MVSVEPPGSLDLTDLAVDDQGLRFTLAHPVDRVVDVMFDGRRIWSFWTVRDTVEETQHGGTRSGARAVSWPDVLRRFLDGTVTLSVVDHVAQRELGSVEAVLGAGEGRVEVVDREGRPLGLDKSHMLSRLFDSRDPEQLAPLMDAIGTVLEALRDCGVDGFLAYGTLLGAVREGGLIGHDSDADLGYVSTHTEPVDAIGESFRIQRRMVEMGYDVTRYSGMAFRVDLVEADGAKRGLDVFAGLVRDGVLYLMGEVGAPFEREWLWPQSEVSLEGHLFPAPAEPEKLLEAMYGPHWRTPDPAFKFETSLATQRRLDGWFRGTRGGRNLEWAKPDVKRLREEPVEGSAFARWVAEREPEIGTLIDLGCGTGADAYWFASRGVNAQALDFRPSSYRPLAARADEEGLPITFSWANFNELRSALCAGALMARTPGPRVVTARHVADAADPTGRRGLLRVAEMASAGSGRAYLQLLTQAPAQSAAHSAGGPPVPLIGDNQRPLDLEAFLQQVRDTGGVVEHQEHKPPKGQRSSGGERNPSQSHNVSRLVIRWR